MPEVQGGHHRQSEDREERGREGGREFDQAAASIAGAAHLDWKAAFCVIARVVGGTQGADEEAVGTATVRFRPGHVRVLMGR